MGFRFRKSMKIAPGIRLNMGKKGVGMSFGGKGFRYSVNSSGRKTTSVSIPGTGLSYSTSSSGTKKGKKVTSKAQKNPYKPDAPPKNTDLSSMILGIFSALTGCWCLGGFLGLFARKMAKNSISNFGENKFNKIGLISSYIGIGLAILALIYGLIFGDYSTDNQSAKQSAPITTVALPTTEAPTTAEITTEEATTEEITTEEATTEKPKKPKQKKKKKEEQALQEEQVWVSGSGKKYHSRANCSGMKNPSQVSISTAESRGLSPCKRCH